MTHISIAAMWISSSCQLRLDEGNVFSGHRTACTLDNPNIIVGIDALPHQSIIEYRYITYLPWWKNEILPIQRRFCSYQLGLLWRRLNLPQKWRGNLKVFSVLFPPSVWNVNISGGSIEWRHHHWYHMYYTITCHGDVIKWKHFPRYWPFVRGIHRSPANFPHKGQWRGTLMFCLICVWINDCVNNREAGDLRRCHTLYEVIVMLMVSETSPDS